ncbi:MAG: hypothetical protein II742_04130 [Clostridia bacterium]|nr:hypothetical protein [Clostridia bacterium]
MDCSARSLLTTEEKIVGQVESLDCLKVSRMNRASLVFTNERGAEFFATRKVANKILAGNATNAILLERTLRGEGGFEIVQNWLALPSIF